MHSGIAFVKIVRILYVIFSAKSVPCDSEKRLHLDSQNINRTTFIHKYTMIFVRHFTTSHNHLCVSDTVYAEYSKSKN